jgi:hypothetical protein
VSRNAWAPLRAKTSADDEFRRSERRDRGFADSSLEGEGFEPSVPVRGATLFETARLLMKMAGLTKIF